MSEGFIYSDEIVRQAFRKLQAHIYFDKNDLHNREKIAALRLNKNNNLDNYFLEIATKLEKGPDFFLDELNNIKLKILPKSVEPKEKEIKFPSNFYTNEYLIKNSEVTNLAIFIDVPVELQIVGVLWLMKYGCAIDNSFKSCNFGNRLFINQNKELGDGRTLFKPYQEQYQLWWSKAVDKTKELLDSKEDSTILNFDLKSFFHTISIKMRGKLLRRHL